MRDVWVFIAIILCGFVLYLGPLRSAFFCFDDPVSIVNNNAIKQIDIPRIFNAFNTRSLVGLSFALNYKWCVLNPAAYRLVNLLVHCLNAFLVYLLIKSTLNTPSGTAFLGSLLFLCHPVQTETVNYITQRFVLMGSFFYLLTLVLYIQYRYRFQKRYMIAGMASALAAMFCKEFTVTLPLMLVLYEFYFINSNNEGVWERLRRLTPFFIIVLIVPVLLLRTPSQAVGVAKIARHSDITRANNSISRKQYFLTELNVMCTYVRLLFVPVNQDFDYDYPISNGVDGKTLMSGIFLLCLLGTAWATYKSCRIVSFAILWFFIALSVESSFIPIGHVIAEYRLYLASVGFAFLVMTIVYSRPEDRRKFNLIAAAVIIGFSVLTYQRNKIWKDELALWNDTIQKSPHKARAYSNRAKTYMDRGLLTQAMSDINKAIELNPNYAEFYINRGSIYEKQGKITKALIEYTKAIIVNPDYALAYKNRAGIYAKQGDLIQAVSDYTKVIEIDPDDEEAHMNLGVAYGKQGKLNQAISEFNKALEINPDDKDAYKNRAFAYSLL